MTICGQVKDETDDSRNTHACTHTHIHRVILNEFIISSFLWVMLIHRMHLNISINSWFLLVCLYLVLVVW